jgi:hypothetical protein
MALVTMNEGELELLDKMLKDALSTDEGYSLKLFKNDYTPVAASTGSSFTEADFTNYAAKSLTRAGWGAASTDGNGAASATYGSAQTWTCGATGNTVYGYYVVAATSAKVLWAERLSSARTLANGDQLTLTPVLTLQSAN